MLDSHLTVKGAHNKNKKPAGRTGGLLGLELGAVSALRRMNSTEVAALRAQAARIRKLDLSLTQTVIELGREL